MLPFLFLDPLGYNFSQRSPTTRSSVERTAGKAFLLHGCFGALYQTHIVADRIPNSYFELRDKLRVNSPKN